MKQFIIPLLILLSTSLYSLPYGLKKIKKPIEFDLTTMVNYTIINHEPYTQFLLIPELMFKEPELGFGLYLPLEINYDMKVRSIEYNSALAIFEKIYYVQYGFNNKSPIFIKLSKIDDYTLGHGLILQRYSNHVSSQEIRKLGTQIQLSYNGLHFDGLMGDVVTQSVTGGRFSINLGEVTKSKSGLLAGFEAGISFIGDFNPKNRQLVEVNTNTNHKIVLRNSSSSSVFAYGADLSLMFNPNSSILKVGLFGEFAKLNLSGEGIGYGVLGTILPESLGLDYKFQFRHLFNSFTPSYFDSFYESFRSYRVDSISNQQATMGWYAEISRKFYKNHLGFVIAYDEVFNGSYNPHLFFKFHGYNVPKRVHFTLRYDRFNFQKFSHLVNVENLDSRFLFEFYYRFTRNIELGFAYEKGFILEENPSEQLSKLVNISIFTKIRF